MSKNNQTRPFNVSVKAQTHCRHFNGYKPCGLNETCHDLCPSLSLAPESILLIHLGALGAVVRSTALLAGIQRKHPAAKVIWVTDSPAHHLLKHHPAIDQVLTTSAQDLLKLKAMDFVATYVVDKNLMACGVAEIPRTSGERFGFSSRNNVIVPATAAAEELYSIGLSNHKKFFDNKKSEIQLTFEALELGPYQKEDYWLPLTKSEETEKLQRQMIWSQGGQFKVIGINTGCSDVLQYKKWDLDRLILLVKKLQAQPQYRVVLLGGPEDQIRNELIREATQAFCTDTNKGLRDGLVSVAACDFIFSGDSLGMHMAISQKVPVVAWFGPTCSHEIELFGRGVAIESSMSCSPCWNRNCQVISKCNSQVDVDQVVNALAALTSQSREIELSL